MSIIKVGIYPKSLMTGDPRDVEKLEYVIQADYLNNDRSHHRVVSISGNWNIRKDDPNFKILGTLDDMLKEQIPKEVLDLIRELPDLNTIFPKNMWPDMAVINDGLSADDILKVYSVDSLVQMLVRAQLLINHIEPIIEKLRPTKVEEKETAKPSKRVPQPKIADLETDKTQISKLSEEFIRKHLSGKPGRPLEAEPPVITSGQYYRRPDGTIVKAPATLMADEYTWSTPPTAYTGTPSPVPNQRFAMTQADLDNLSKMISGSETEELLTDYPV